VSVRYRRGVTSDDRAVHRVYVEAINEIDRRLGSAHADEPGATERRTPDQEGIPLGTFGASAPAFGQAPAADRMKSVPNPARSPMRSATLAAIGTARRRDTAIISLNTKMSAPAARPRNTIDRSGDTKE
jgi:hypothetical protein